MTRTLGMPLNKPSQDNGPGPRDYELPIADLDPTDFAGGAARPGAFRTGIITRV